MTPFNMAGRYQLTGKWKKVQNLTLVFQTLYQNTEFTLSLNKFHARMSAK
jgi:hypothetical protein